MYTIAIDFDRFQNDRKHDAWLVVTTLQNIQTLRAGVVVVVIVMVIATATITVAVVGAIATAFRCQGYFNCLSG